MKAKTLFFLIAISLIPAVACGDDSGKVWDPNPPIEVSAAPSKTKVKTGEEIVFYGACKDMDQWYVLAPPDASASSIGAGGGANITSSGQEVDICAGIWSKTGGVWTSSTNTNDLNIGWRAPKEPGTYVFTLTVDDVPSSVSRDDTVAASSFAVRCAKYCGEKELPAAKECCEQAKPSQPYSPDKECCEKKGVLDKYKIRDLNDCPNRVKRWSYPDPQPNGCSVPWFAPYFYGVPFADTDNPAGGKDTQFATFRDRPCDWHDRCWGTCSGSEDPMAYRNNCDNDFYDRMLRVCDESKEIQITKDYCRRWARTYYYEGVQTKKGTSLYVDGQKEACQCCV